MMSIVAVFLTACVGLLIWVVSTGKASDQTVENAVALVSAVLFDLAIICYLTFFVLRLVSVKKTEAVCQRITVHFASQNYGFLTGVRFTFTHELPDGKIITLRTNSIFSLLGPLSANKYAGKYVEVGYIPGKNNVIVYGIVPQPIIANSDDISF